ncbi:acetyltransferase [Agromyces sp. Root81]|uniref:acetyltransferase n=1 Tax=Agromyces sp. Root81 TaxID=1736601 RepID=UPI0007004494|nr:acetyltransferase [Agromyces sp. Root81]KRC62789.1 acetyltransferase [Agromyces sp. Root81]
MHPLLVIGASGLAREAIVVARAAGLDPIGIVDDDASRLPYPVAGVPVIGPIDRVLSIPEARLLVCIGSGAARERVVARLARLGVDRSRYATLIDPSVRNPGESPIGVGSILLAGVVVTVDALLGDHVVVMPNTTITHDCMVGDFATLTAGVSLGGGVSVGRRATLGMNAAVRQHLSIGADAVIGMGAVVLHDVPAGATWVGVPASPMRYAEAGGA